MDFPFYIGDNTKSFLTISVDTSVDYVTKQGLFRDLTNVLSLLTTIPQKMSLFYII